MLFNNDTPFVKESYKRYNIKNITAFRFISCNVNKRNKQNKFIIKIINNGMSKHY